MKAWERVEEERKWGIYKAKGGRQKGVRGTTPNGGIFRAVRVR